MSDTDKGKGQVLNELRRSSASGTHGKHGKARNRDERRKVNRNLKNGEWS